MAVFTLGPMSAIENKAFKSWNERDHFQLASSGEVGLATRHWGRGKISIGRERGKEHSSGKKELGSKGSATWWACAEDAERTFGPARPGCGMQSCRIPGRPPQASPPTTGITPSLAPSLLVLGMGPRSTFSKILDPCGPNVEWEEKRPQRLKKRSGSSPPAAGPKYMQGTCWGCGWSQVGGCVATWVWGRRVCVDWRVSMHVVLTGGISCDCVLWSTGLSYECSVC